MNSPPALNLGATHASAKKTWQGGSPTLGPAPHCAAAGCGDAQGPLCALTLSPGTPKIGQRWALQLFPSMGDMAADAQ